MSDDKKGVEEKVETAPSQQEVDLAKELEETRAALERKSKDAENYKRGMLKAKGKLPAEELADEDTGETLEDKMRRIAREEQDASEIAHLQAKEKATTDAILKRNKELEIALKNRGQVTSTSAAGSNEDKADDVKSDTFFSPEQLAFFKKKGWDDKKIEQAKKNMLKGAKP